MPRYLLLKRRVRAPALARRDLPAAATAYAEAARRATNVAERDHLVRRAARSGRPSCRKVVSLSVLRPDSGTPGPPPVAPPTPKERRVMDPQEITEEPQDRTGSWVGRHDEYTPQELAGGRS
jgi:hypothetical protein